MTLKEYRSEIAKIDQEILSLVLKRMNMAKKVGEFKKQHQTPIKNYEIEKKIIDRARLFAESHDLSEALIENIFQSLIEASVSLQDELMSQHYKSSENNKSQNIAIVGGCGKMGIWLADFFCSYGHSITICDISKPKNCKYSYEANIEKATKRKDFVFLTTSITEAPAVLDTLIDLNTEAVLVDICSLKEGLIPYFMKAVDRGQKTASIHPMFGPDVKTLVGRNMVFCEGPLLTNTTDVISLFENSTANIIKIPFDDHDRLMQYVLGTAHLLNLSFAAFLADSGISLDQLLEVAGTTFKRQIEVTKGVVCENQGLYYDIQHASKPQKTYYCNLIKSISTYVEAISEDRRDEFIRIMKKSADYFSAEDA